MTMRYNDTDESLLFRAGGTDAGKLMDEPCCTNENNCTPPLRCSYNVTLADLVGELAEWNGSHVVTYFNGHGYWFATLRTGMYPVWLKFWWLESWWEGVHYKEWYCQLTENIAGGGEQYIVTWCRGYDGELQDPCEPTGALPFVWDTHWPYDQYDSTAVVS